MRIDGYWSICDDGQARPMLSAEVELADGSWLFAEFLLDTGADLTAFTSQFLSMLTVEGESDQHIGGVGGRTEVALATTRIRCLTADGTQVILRGRFPIVQEAEHLDLPVLGRDIARNFAVIVDQPGDTVCLLSQRHRYRIESV